MLWRESLRILLVHNYYYSGNPSGENMVFDAERALLRCRNHEVEVFSRSSDELRHQGTRGVIKGALGTPWNPFTARKLSLAVERAKSDIVHVHNTFPLISPSIFHAIGKRAARVLTLHNYRLVCPAAIPMRAGQVCTECLNRRSVWPSLLHGCYRNSRLATVPLATSIALHRWLGTWHREVDAFIALSEFQRERMAAAGLPERKIHVKPNFFPGHPEVVPYQDRDPYVVFVGRLSEEKGVSTLLSAWRAWGVTAPELRIIGDGPLRKALERDASNLPVHFAGQLPPEAAQHAIAKARLLVLPSQWFEGFPMVLREAFAFGTPAVVSNLGPLPSLVGHGRCGTVFLAGDPSSLLEAVRRLWEAPAQLAALSQAARSEFEEKYTEEANYEMLMRIYAAAIEENMRAR